MIEFLKGLPPEWRADIVFITVLMAREVTTWLNNRWRKKLEGNLSEIKNLLREVVKTNEKLHAIQEKQLEIDRKLAIIDRQFPELRTTHHKINQ